MKKLFIQFILTIFILFIASLVILHVLSQTPDSKVPGLTPLHLIPSRGFLNAVIFSNEHIIKEFWVDDSISDTFYRYASSFLPASFYSVKYSMLVKNAIGKYVVFARYNDGSFILVTKPRFRLKLLRYFQSGEKKDYEGIPTYKTKDLYYYFVEDYLVITPNLELLKRSCDIAVGKRMGSVFDDVGNIDDYDFTYIFQIKDALLVLDPVVLGISRDKMFIKAKIASSVIFDAMKGGNLPDSLPKTRVFLGLGMPYLELYDAYVSHYPNDELDLASIFWDIGGNGFLWWDGASGFLISLLARVPEERLVSDIFTYLKMKDRADSVVPQPALHLYAFKKGDSTCYLLQYINGVNENRFVLTNKKSFYDAFGKHEYTKDDGFLYLGNDFGFVLKKSSYLNSLINWYMEKDSLNNTDWRLDIKEYRKGLYIEGKRSSKK